METKNFVSITKPTPKIHLSHSNSKRNCKNQSAKAWRRDFSREKLEISSFIESEANLIWTHRIYGYNVFFQYHFRSLERNPSDS